MISDVRNFVGLTGLDSRLSISGGRAVSAAADRQPPSDQDLVLAARQGDRAAFGQLYALYARMVHGILLAKVPLPDVDDLVQDVFLRAMSRLGDLRDVARFGPWLAAIARNCAHDYHRQTRAGAAMTDSLSEDFHELSASSTASETNANLILASLRCLPGAYRETLILRLVEGMTGPEIAARTGMTPGSVRVNLHRGVRKLRNKLGEASLRETTNSNPITGKDSAPQRKFPCRKGNQP